jgi:hypothetical protein
MHAYYLLASLGSRIPASSAIALAVSILSPVTILILIPALWQILTDGIISSLSGSYNAYIPIKIRLVSNASLSASAAKLLLDALILLYSSVE